MSRKIECMLELFLFVCRMNILEFSNPNILEEIIPQSNKFFKSLLIKGAEQWKVQENKELASTISILSSPEQRARQCTGNSANNTTRGTHSYSADADNSGCKQLLLRIALLVADEDAHRSILFFF